MPSTNKTEFLKLNNWVNTDKPLRTDFNKDNELIDDWAKEVNEIVKNTASEQENKLDKLSIDSPIVVTTANVATEVLRIHSARYTLAGELLMVVRGGSAVEIYKYLFGARVNQFLELLRTSSVAVDPSKMQLSVSREFTGNEDYDLIFYLNSPNAVSVTTLLIGTNLNL